MAYNGNPTSADLVTVDPNFSLPPGVAGVEYTNPDDAGDVDFERDSVTGELVSEEFGQDDLVSLPDGGMESTGLAPDYINVVQQIMRQTSDGRYVVDIIVEVDDMPNVTSYEVGMTKQ